MASVDNAPDRPTSPSGRLPRKAGALGAVVGPFTRTGRCFTESLRDYLDDEPRELPIARPSIALAAQAFRDPSVKVRAIVPRPGTLEKVAELARDWFIDHLSGVAANR